MNRPLGLGALAVLMLATGCESTDPGCLRVDGRGASGAYRTIDDALVAAVAGDVICLDAGEHASPTGPITVPVTLRGSSGTTPSVVTGTGGCQTAAGVAWPTVGGAPVTLDAAIVVSAPAPVRLETLSVRNCPVGIVARGAGIALADVLIEDVLAGVWVDSRADADIRGGVIRPGTRGGEDALPVGIALADETSLALDGGARIEGRGLDAGVLGRSADVTIGDALLTDNTYALFVWQEGAASTRRVVLNPGARIERQRATLPAGEPTSLIIGGTVDIDGASFAGSQGRGIVLDSVDRATVRRTSFAGIDRFALVALGSDLEVGEGLTMDLPAGGVGLASGTYIGDAGERRLADVRVMAPFTSTGGAGSIHVGVVDGSRIAIVAAGSTMTGGATALWASGGATLESASATVRETTVGGALGVDSTLTLDGFDVDLSRAATDALAAVAVFGGSADLAGLRSTAGPIGIHAADVSMLSVTDAQVRETTGIGILLTGTAPASAILLDDIIVEAAGSNGVVVDSGWDVALSLARVADCDGPGVEAREGSRLTVTGSELSGNLGAGVAFYGASGYVVSTTLSATRPVLEAGAMRADELRVVSTTTPVEVFVGDDGDRVFTPGAEVHFVTGAPGCDAASCSAIFVDGTGATGIVTPNCLAASGAATVRSLVDQDGATIEFLGPTNRAAYDALLSGTLSGVDVGFAPGASIVPPVLMPIAGIGDVRTPRIAAIGGP